MRPQTLVQGETLRGLLKESRDPNGQVSYSLGRRDRKTVPHCYCPRSIVSAGYMKILALVHHVSRRRRDDDGRRITVVATEMAAFALSNAKRLPYICVP